LARIYFKSLAVLPAMLMLGVRIVFAQDDADSVAVRARQAMADHNWPQAARELEHLAALAPAVPEVRANLGMAYYFQGRPAEALVWFEKARKLNPHIAQGDLMIGLCQVELGRDQEAVGLLAPAFRNPPDAGMGRLAGLSLMRAYANLLNVEKSMAIGEELLRRYPDDPEILFEVSRLHAERSYHLLSQLVRADPSSLWVHYSNAQVQESLQRFDVARQEYEKVRQMNSALAGVSYHLGRVILLNGRDPKSLEEARNAFEQELAVSPRNADAEYELGEMDRESGNDESALPHFQRAVEFHPEFFEARLGLGRVLLKLAKPAEAVQHLEAAARLDDRNKLPHYLLANAFTAIGNATRASSELAIYKKLGGSGAKANE
jgi:tetratricopeptide (TPR) repeat protein